jgi:peptide/nickel transport system permease protein
MAQGILTRKTGRTARRGRKRVLSTWTGRIGLLFILFVLFIALFGPLFAPHSPVQTVGIPGQPSSPGYPLGLDFEGRDVLSRLLSGGRSTILIAASATLLTYALGLPIGLVAGYTRSIVDPLLMRTVDIFLSLPGLLLMLLIVVGLGSRPIVLVLAAALVLFPGVARIARSATQEITTRSYVEAAVGRGERSFAVLRREILPNIAGPLIADLGLRFSWSIILVASVNFLGLGISPPTPDWGVMISENRSIIQSNPMGVIAPALMLAILILGVNLVGDTYIRQLGRSGDARD